MKVIFHFPIYLKNKLYFLILINMHNIDLNKKNYKTKVFFNIIKIINKLFISFYKILLNFKFILIK